LISASRESQANREGAGKKEKEKKKKTEKINDIGRCDWMER
jgi:hypothetical protein